MTTRKFRISLLVACCALAAVTFLFAATAQYQVDKVHSNVGFSIRHLLSQVQGKFDTFEGVIVYDAEAPAAGSVEFTVDAKSINTGNDRRDTHLRSADFFDVEKFPKLTFRSEKVEAKGPGDLAVTGPFTMHGVTKTMTIPVKVLGVIKTQAMGTRAGFEAHFTVNRKDFGINWNVALETGGVLVADLVKVHAEVEVVYQEQPEAVKVA